jgi:cytochrome c oxidase subunit 3
MYTGPASAFFYLLTATHALHLVGGLIALMYAGWISAFSLDLRRGAVLVDAASWYWHAMAILWIYLYALLLFGT